MAMIEYLEKDKEKLLERLREAKTPERAGRVVEEELDRLLLRFNEQCESERSRESSAFMLQTARAAVPMLGTAGEPKVWESAAGSGRAEGTPPVPVKSRILLIAGIVCGAVSLGAQMGLSSLMHIAALPASALFLACALLCVYGAGYFRFSGKGKTDEKKAAVQIVEVPVDPAKVYRCLRAVILSVDQNLGDIRMAEEWDRTHGSSAAFPGESGEPDGAETALLSDLLEAAYSGDGAYALEKLSGIRYYLHRRGIELVDYTAETAGYFDIMPARGQTATLRPAMLAQGRLLRKGVAAEGAI